LEPTIEKTFNGEATQTILHGLTTEYPKNLEYYKNLKDVDMGTTTIKEVSIESGSVTTLKDVSIVSASQAGSDSTVSANPIPIPDPSPLPIPNRMEHVEPLYKEIGTQTGSLDSYWETFVNWIKGVFSTTSSDLGLSINKVTNWKDNLDSTQVIPSQVSDTLNSTIGPSPELDRLVNVSESVSNIIASSDGGVGES
jgi:hypothetical protein